MLAKIKKMTKVITLLILLFSFFIGNSQSLSNKNILKLNKLDIKTEKLNLNGINIQNDLNEILFLDKKRRRNKRTGIILTSLSVLTTTFGIFALTHDKANDGTGRAYQELIGGMSLGIGIASGGITIPIFNSAKKRKKERDKLIGKYSLN